MLLYSISSLLLIEPCHFAIFFYILHFQFLLLQLVSYLFYSRAVLDKRAQELGVDPRYIFGGNSVRLKKCEYTGFATTIYSIDNAIACLEYIGMMAGEYVVK